MQLSKWPAIGTALLVIAACFFPWVVIESRNIAIGGFHSDVGDYGKPGIAHTFLCGLCIIFLLVKRLWSVRAAFFISAVNIAWALRNFFLISACQGGRCPAKQPALYVLLASSCLLTLLILAVRVEPAREPV